MKRYIKRSKIRFSYADVKKNNSDNKVKNSVVNENVKKKNNRCAMIRETKADKEIEQTDNISILMMVIVIVICFIVGIALGYILYNLAISSSDSAFIVSSLLNILKSL